MKIAAHVQTEHRPQRDGAQQAAGESRRLAGFEASPGTTKLPVQMLEESIGSLEGGGAMVFQNGKAALDAILGQLPEGRRVLVDRDLDPATRRNLDQIQRRKGFDVQRIDASNQEPFRSAKLDKVGLVLVGSPTDPLFRSVDLRETVRSCRDHGVLVVVENNLLGPVFQRPLELGADYSLYSTSKWLGGSAYGGVGVVAFRKPEVASPFDAARGLANAVVEEEDARLLLRELRTVHQRAERIQSSARRLADWVSRHPKVVDVHFPTTSERPGAANLVGSGLSFELDDPWVVRAFLRSLKRWRVEEGSSGGESVAIHPWDRTHSDLSESDRRKSGISENLVRLVVGLEDPEDLLEDLDQALSNPSFSFADVWDWVI